MVSQKVVCPWAFVKRWIKCSEGTDLNMPTRRKVLFQVLKTKEYNEFLGHCKMPINTGGVTTSFKDFPGESKDQKQFSSAMTFCVDHIETMYVYHECSHAAYELLTEIKKVNKKLSRRTCEEIRAYSVGYLIWKLEEFFVEDRKDRTS